MVAYLKQSDMALFGALLKTLDTLLKCQVMVKFMYRDEFVCFSYVHQLLRYV